MVLAIRLDQLIHNGHVADQAELARLEHVSPARVTQIMNLLNLAPTFRRPFCSGRPLDAANLTRLSSDCVIQSQPMRMDCPAPSCVCGLAETEKNVDDREASKRRWRTGEIDSLARVLKSPEENFRKT